MSKLQCIQEVYRDNAVLLYLQNLEDMGMEDEDLYVEGEDEVFPQRVPVPPSVFDTKTERERVRIFMLTIYKICRKYACNYILSLTNF